MADDFDEIELMLDATTGEPVFDAHSGEFLMLTPSDNCCDPPVCGSIDVIHIIDGAPKRERLTRTTRTTLWTTDVTPALTFTGAQSFTSVWLQDEMETRHQLAFTHDETPGDQGDGLWVVVTNDHTGDGEVESTLYNEFHYEVFPPGPEDNGCGATLTGAQFWLATQEANGVSAGVWSAAYASNCYPGWVLSSLATMSVGGVLELFDFSLPPWCSPDTIYKGGGRIGDILYACIQARTVPLDGDPFSGHTGTCNDPEPPKLVRCRLQGLGIPAADVVDLSPWLSDAFWTVLDEGRDLFYIAGAAITGELTILSVTTGGVVDVLTTVPSAFSANGIGAMTLLNDGLYFITAGASAGQSAWRYSFGAGALIRLVDEGSAYWPLMRGDGMGTAFIVGATGSCNENCACVPQLTLTRAFPLLEDEEGPDNCLADPFRPGCCGLSLEEVMHFSCLYYFDYEITLCGDRTLSFVKFQGARGQVHIEGVGPVSGITDWSTLPLTGRMFFGIAGDAACGPINTELRITLIDSQDCCATFSEDLFCCKCCPAGGGVTISGDDCEMELATADGCGTVPDCASGEVWCGGFPFESPCYPAPYDVYHWYKFEFDEGVSSPCSGSVPENRVCYVCDWGTLEARGGGSLPGIVSGGTVRVRHHAISGTPRPACVRIWAYDALGDVECRTLVVEAAFVSGCVFEPGTPLEDIGLCCQDRGYNTTFTCGDQWPPQ